MSLLQNEYNKRLAEKLKRQAEKRDDNPAFAEELARVAPAAEAVTPQKREKSSMGGKEKTQE